MYTLGINAVYHDPAACLVRDGVVVAAAEEERFTHVKHGKRPVPFSTWELPFHAIDYCLKEAGLDLTGVDHVAYSFDPYLLLGRRGDATIELPLEPSALPKSDDWRSPWDPVFLASFGKPRFLAEFRDVVRLGGKGQYTIGPLRLEERFGPRRFRGGPIEQRHYDVAHSLQVVLEETVLEIARWLYAAAGRVENLTL